MGAWNTGASIVSVLAAAGLALLVAGCVWPLDDPRRSSSAPRSTGRPKRSSAGHRPAPDRPPVPAPWDCAQPNRPFTLADAHLWMQQHREHDCARKHAAFAALVAAGRIQPDSSRPQRLWSINHD